uniref:Uncharacterized protein n=1 Tax=Picea glauca TaxID=3330 RepID=A0A101LYP8_PICGL|nr:hypothetical protein ABT39_MTgene5825 [Picea glauca]QHR92307.1 hypothetical protein Q903MT_gene6349 [Picea sitchensis]
MHVLSVMLRPFLNLGLSQLDLRLDILLQLIAPHLALQPAMPLSRI